MKRNELEERDLDESIWRHIRKQPMDYAHQPSYQKALQKTYDTTYKDSYRTVDTYHKSPVYTERNAYSGPKEFLPKYPRVSYPYQREYPGQLSTGQEGTQHQQPPGLWRDYYLFDYDSNLDERFKPQRVYKDELMNLRRPLPMDKSYDPRIDSC